MEEGKWGKGVEIKRGGIQRGEGWDEGSRALLLRG